MDADFAAGPEQGLSTREAPRAMAQTLSRPAIEGFLPDPPSQPHGD